MKKTLRVLTFLTAMTAFMLLLSVFTFAETVISGDYQYTVNVDGSTITITKYTGSETECTIPERIDGHTVTVIGEEAFSGNASIVSLAIPDTVTRIETYAFFKNAALTKVVFPDSLTYIGKYAFQNCTLLSDYEIPANIITLDSYSFNKTAVSTITIPNTLVTLGNGVFKAVTTLKYVNFEDNSSLKSIGSSTFEGCTSLRSIEIPGSVTELVSNTFNGCTSLESIIFENNENQVYVGGGLVEGCTSLIRADLPNGMTKLNMETFNECTKLERVIIPDSVTQIGEHAFLNCNNLKSITLGKNITKITDSITAVDDSTGIFNGCYKMEAIYLWRGSYADEYCKSRSAIAPLIVYLDDLYTTELEFTLSDDGAYYTVTGIGSCTDTYIEIPAEYQGLPVKAIGEGAFAENTAIKKLIMPKTVERIDARAFYGCTALLSVIFKEESRLNYIGDSAFEGCSKLIAFDAPHRLIHIGRRAFAGCTALRRIVLRELIEFIGEEIFEGCTNIPNNIYTLEGSYADNYCSERSHKRNHYRKLESNNISVSGDSDTVIPGDFEISADELDENDIRDKHGDKFGKEDKMHGHDIKLHVEGQKLQPNDSVTVEMDVPEGFDGETCDVYRQEKDGSLTKMDVDHHDGKLRFETDHFSTYIVIEDMPAADFLSFDGFQVRRDDYNGLRSRFTADLARISELKKTGYEVVEFGTVMASSDRLTENGDELTVSKNESGAYSTVSYGRLVPVWQSGNVVNKYISKSGETLTFACTVVNYSVSNFDLEIYVRGYAVIRDQGGNEYVVYSDYSNENYRSLSLERACDDLAAAGLIDTSVNISYIDVVAFKKEREEQEV